MKDVLFNLSTSSISITQPFGFVSLISRDKNTWNVINNYAFPGPTVAYVSSVYITDTAYAGSYFASQFVSTPYVNTSNISSYDIVASNSISTNTLTLGSIGSSISAASASISVNFTNSEGTSNNSTILVSATKVNAGNTGATGSAGTNGAPGSNGNDGRRTATGMVFYQPSAASAPATPSATSYTFSSNSFGSLTTNWGIGAPTYASGNSNKYWYSTYSVVETTAGGGTGTPTFGTPTQAIGFSGHGISNTMEKVPQDKRIDTFQMDKKCIKVK
jgi:hypothetical protein